MGQGDRLILFTDCILNMSDGKGEKMGGERLNSLFERHASSGSKDFIKAAWGELEMYRERKDPDDDATLFTFRLQQK